MYVITRETDTFYHRRVIVMMKRTKKLVVLSLLLGGLWQVDPLPALAVTPADPTYDVITVSGNYGNNHW